MSEKRNPHKKPGLAGVKWMLTALAVTATLGLWQVFAGDQTQDGAAKASAAAARQSGQNTPSQVEARVPPAVVSDLPAAQPVKIILPGAQAPAPLVITRSS